MIKIVLTEMLLIWIDCEFEFILILYSNIFHRLFTFV